jgi:enolase-phosphatase E1
MDRDRKSPGLKLAQGLIWEDGYQGGELRGQVYDDVPPAMRAWRDAGLDIAIYSSGSELAQRRLFESVPDGNLTPMIRAFFDTRVGAKVEPASYVRIAEALGRAPGEILFVSDVTRELAAARAAGLQVVLSLRPGNATQADAAAYRAIRSFLEL